MRSRLNLVLHGALLVGSAGVGFIASIPHGTFILVGVLLAITGLVLVLKQPKSLLVVAFLLTWSLGVEQYAFVPALAFWLLMHYGEPGRRAGGLPLLLGVVAALGVIAWVDVDDTGALRTTAVWGAGALLVAAWRTCNDRGRTILVGTLITVWLMSLAVAFATTMSPGLGDALNGLRRPIGTLATNPGFTSPTEYLGREWNRPVGFLLYANELAFFGLTVAALAVALWGERKPRFTGALVLLSILGAFVSSSRTLSVLIAAAVAAWLLGRIGGRAVPWLLRACLLGACIAAAYLALTFYDPIGEWRRELANEFIGARAGDSDEDRRLSYAVGLDLFLANQWTGLGLLPLIGPIQAGSHSLPLSMAVRFGIPGVVLLIAFLVPVLFAALKRFLESRTGSAWVGIVGVVAIGACLSIQFDGDVYSFAAFCLLAAALLDVTTPTPTTAEKPCYDPTSQPARPARSATPTRTKQAETMRV